MIAVLDMSSVVSRSGWKFGEELKATKAGFGFGRSLSRSGWKFGEELKVSNAPQEKVLVGRRSGWKFGEELKDWWRVLNGAARPRRPSEVSSVGS